MPKDIHVLQIVGDPVGGIRRHVHALLFGLSSYGIRQSYSYSTVSNDLVFREEIPSLIRLLEDRVLPLPIPKKPSLNDLSNIIRLRRFINEAGVTVVHGHGAKGGAYARILSILCDVKSVYTPHGGAVHDMFGPIESSVYTFAEKMLLPLTDKFVFESEYSSRAYFDRVGRRPRDWAINYNGIPKPSIDPSLKRFPASGEVLNIGVFGMLRSQKGQVYAIRAISSINSRRPVRLHLYGDGQDKAFLIDEVRKLGVTNSVVFHGETSSPLECMRDMDIILIPSLFESFGYVAIEAFSLKRPVVASNVGGLPEIISDGKDGLLVAAKAQDEIAAGVIKLCDSPQLAEQMGEKGYLKAAEKFSLKSMLFGLAEIYKKLYPESCF